MADDFETALSPDLASDEQALIVDVAGFEGPLDLLLILARQQKIERALEALDVDDQRLLVGGEIGRQCGFEIVGHQTYFSLRMI